MCLRVLDSVWMAPTCCPYTEASAGPRSRLIPAGTGFLSAGSITDSFFRRKPLWSVMDWNGSFHIDPRKARWLPWFSETYIRDERRRRLCMFALLLAWSLMWNNVIWNSVWFLMWKNVNVRIQMPYSSCVSCCCWWNPLLMSWYLSPVIVGELMIFWFDFVCWPSWRPWVLCVIILCCLIGIVWFLSDIIISFPIKHWKSNHLFLHLGTLSFKVSTLLQQSLSKGYTGLATPVTLSNTRSPRVKRA